VQVTIHPTKPSQWSPPAERSLLDTPQASEITPHNELPDQPTTHPSAEQTAW
jgi:hypothetical protein